MRKWINLVESVFPPEIAQAIIDWQGYADHGEAHGEERHQWQNQIISYMKEHPHTVHGTLYRATRCADAVAEQLMLGNPATHKKIGSLLESWSKTLDAALAYADSNIDQHSIVVMAFDASHLKVVCDIDLIPFDASYVREENEVLVMAEDRALNKHNVEYLLYHDYDGKYSNSDGDTLEYEGFSPDVTKGKWRTFRG